MNMNNLTGICMALIITTGIVSAQNGDKVIFIDSEPGFYQNTIL